MLEATENIIKDLSNAFYFLFPLLGLFLYPRYRARFSSNLVQTYLYTVLTMVGATLVALPVFLAIYAILVNFSVLTPWSTDSVGVWGIGITILAVIISAVERQRLQAKQLLGAAIEQNQQDMDHRVATVTRLARSEVLMFCGTMSFLGRDSKQFEELKRQGCRVRALCKSSTSEDVQGTYRYAETLGIEIGFYPEYLDPGVRGRIIDSGNQTNACAVLIDKSPNSPNTFVTDNPYTTLYLRNQTHPLEMTLLNTLFNTLWRMSNEGNHAH